MRKVYRGVYRGLEYVWVDSFDDNLFSCGGTTHEEAIRGLHHLLTQGVQQFDNLLMLLEEEIEGVEDICKGIFEEYNCDYRGDDVKDSLSKLRLLLKVIARDIETGSVEYVKVDVEDEQ